MHILEKYWETFTIYLYYINYSVPAVTTARPVPPHGAGLPPPLHPLPVPEHLVLPAGEGPHQTYRGSIQLVQSEFIPFNNCVRTDKLLLLNDRRELVVLLIFNLDGLPAAVVLAVIAALVAVDGHPIRQKNTHFSWGCG